MRKFILSIIIALNAACSFAIGEWTVFPSSQNFRRAEIFDNKYFLLSGNSLYSAQIDNPETQNQYNKLTGLSSSIIFDIIVSKQANKLAIVYSDCNIDFIDIEGVITNLPDIANKSLMGDRTLKGISERNGFLYISTGFGFIIVNIEKCEVSDTFYYDISEYKDGSYGKHISTVSDEDLAALNSKIKINGAASSSNAVLAYSNGILLTGNAESDYRNSNFETQGILSYFDTYSGEWTNIFASDIHNDFTDKTAWFQGITSIAIDPHDNQHFFVGTFSLGIMEFRNGALCNYYNAYNNDGLSTIIPETYNTRIGGFSYDNQDYMWFVNTGVDKPLRCLTPDGHFLAFDIQGYAKVINSYASVMQSNFDPYHFKWIYGMRPWQQCQVGIYYDGGTPEDVSDDESCAFLRLIDQDGNSYLPDYYNAIVEDRKGTVWILTTSGPFVVDKPLEAFKAPGKVRRIKIPRNDGTNLADYLLADVDCFCMCVDAANRKWIGTRENGLYLLSADGTQQLEHFTTDNSPLMSNSILALAIDDQSGNLYISCEGGILCYAGDAVQGAADYSNVICYPNPVRPEYTGNLHITGLKDNTLVRICDIANHVIYSTHSQGGSISWDLSTNNGSRVKAGVYVVYGIDESNNSGIVTKFMVVN